MELPPDCALKFEVELMEIVGADKDAKDGGAKDAGKAGAKPAGSGKGK